MNNHIHPKGKNPKKRHAVYSLTADWQNRRETMSVVKQVIVMCNCEIDMHRLPMMKPES